MNKIISYLKQGKGYGLLPILIFSVLFGLICWGIYYPVLTLQASVARVSVFLVHLGFLVGAIVFQWVLYLVVTGISALLALLFRLKLNKGAIWRSTAVVLIGFFLSASLFLLIAFITAFLGQRIFQFYPYIGLLILLVLFVTLVLSGISEQKEIKKKK